MKFQSAAIPENIRRCMPANDRRELKCPTQPEADAAMCRKLEKEMHNGFINELNRRGILYVHSRMDKKATIKSGWPDFSLFRDGLTIFIEFKVPGNKTSEAQDKCIESLRDNAFIVHVCTSLKDAIDYINSFWI